MQKDTVVNWRPWVMVGLSFLALALAYSTRATFGLVMPLLEQELGWSRSFTSGIAATALMMTAVLAPLAGRLVDRQGARAVTLLGMGLLATGCFLVAVTSHPVAFLVAFGGIAATGFGLVAIHVVSAAVEQEFDANQGLATGIATSGSSAGQLLIVPLLAVLVASYDWRLAFIALGGATVIMMVCVKRWFPSGMSQVRLSENAQGSQTSLAQDTWRILRMPVFQILFWSYFLCGYTTSGVIETHFLPYASFCGFGPIPSATAYGLLSAINLAGMILVGWLTDRVNRPLLLGGIYLIRGLTFILLVHVGTDLETLFLFAVIFGLVDYSTSPVTASLVASHIGIRVMGLAFGLISAGHQIGGAVGAYFGGILFDLYARYDWVWWSSLWLAVLAGLLVLLLRNTPRSGTLAP
ncbi:MFS transporter [Pelagibius sp. Alg239-R121]|uniref:MFS transporter n=1 Tax=Pelagibius sp. Alg239-R121 TaxID=2993448 RepID=UPI0024A6F805|nr:MFS transporter [Pelagibius sp. Alg239-R121]